MEPSLAVSIASFLVVEGLCFACAYTNIFRRLRSVEERLSSLEASRINTASAVAIEPVPVAVQPSFAQQPQQARYPFQAPQMYYYPPQQAHQAPRTSDDPLPISYATYYQSNK